MLLFAIPLLAGLACGLARGGRILGMAGMRARWFVLFAVAVALQIVALFFDLESAASVIVLAASYGLIFIWLFVNALMGQSPLRIGFALIAAGWLINMIVIIPNHGMPVSARTLARAGMTRTGITSQSYRHVLASEKTFAPNLGDTIAIRPLLLVLSPGDVVIMTGIAVIVAQGMTLPVGRERRRALR